MLARLAWNKRLPICQVPFRVRMTAAEIYIWQVSPAVL
jgi:hypothetical protein